MCETKSFDIFLLFKTLDQIYINKELNYQTPEKQKKILKQDYEARNRITIRSCNILTITINYKNKKRQTYSVITYYLFQLKSKSY